MPVPRKLSPEEPKKVKKLSKKFKVTDDMMLYLFELLLDNFEPDYEGLEDIIPLPSTWRKHMDEYRVYPYIEHIKDNDYCITIELDDPMRF